MLAKLLSMACTPRLGLPACELKPWLAVFCRAMKRSTDRL